MKETFCRIRDIYRALDDFENRFQKDYSICFNEGMLLCLLSSVEKCTSGEIAEKLGLTPSNTSKIIASAEKKELIERILGIQDKRYMYFSLADKGRSLLESMHYNINDIEQILANIKRL